MRWNQRWDRLKCRLFGHREPDPHELGIDLRNPDWVELFCSRCGKLISTQPRMEIANEETLSVIDDLFDGYERDVYFNEVEDPDGTRW